MPGWWAGVRDGDDVIRQHRPARALIGVARNRPLLAGVAAPAWHQAKQWHGNGIAAVAILMATVRAKRRLTRHMASLRSCWHGWRPISGQGA